VFSWTIRRDEDVVTVANAGQPYAAITPELIAEALDKERNGPIILSSGVTWALPAGAFGNNAGPE
jgi:hypothetical protein